MQHVVYAAHEGHVDIVEDHGVAHRPLRGIRERERGLDPASPGVLLRDDAAIRESIRFPSGAEAG